MLHTDYAGIVSKSAKGLAKMMTVIVIVLESARLTVSRKKTMLLRTPDEVTPAPPLVIEPAGRRYKQTVHSLYLGSIIHETADLSLEINRRIYRVQACLKRLGPELYDRTTAPPTLKIRMLKAEVLETLLYGCVAWSLRAEHLATLSYTKALKTARTRASSRPSIRKRRLVFGGGRGTT